MSTGRRTYSEILGELQRLLAALNANTLELPQLEGNRSAFEGLVSQAQAMSQEQAALTASKQDKTQQFKFVLSEGQRLATVLRLGVKQHYGISSEKLAEFGLQPFRGRSRKVKDPEPPPAELSHS